MSDDTETFVPDRTDSNLHLDRNNETVVSGMTECSWETPSVASFDSSNIDSPNTSTSLPPSRFRGGTSRRFGFDGSGGSGTVYGGGSVRSRGSRGSRRSRGRKSNKSNHSRLDRSTMSGISNFGPIAEEGEQDMLDLSAHDAAGSPKPNSPQGSERRSTAGDDNSIWMGSENSSVYQRPVGRGGGRGFDTTGMFGPGERSVTSGRSGGASGGQNVGRSRPPPPAGSGGDDNSIWMGSEERSVHLGTSAGPGGFGTTPEMFGGYDSLLSGSFPGTYANFAQDDASVVSDMSFGQSTVASDTSQWLREDMPQRFTSGVANSSNSLAGGRGQFHHNVQAGNDSGSVVWSEGQKSGPGFNNDAAQETFVPQDGASISSGMSFGQHSVASDTSDWLKQDRPHAFTSGVANSSNSLAGGRGQFQRDAQAGWDNGSVLWSVADRSADTRRDRASFGGVGNDDSAMRMESEEHDSARLGADTGPVDPATFGRGSVPSTAPMGSGGLSGTHATVIPQDDVSMVSGMSFGQSTVASNTSQWLREDRPQMFTSDVANSSNSLAGGRGRFQHDARAGSSSSGSVVDNAGGHQGGVTGPGFNSAAPATFDDNGDASGGQMGSDRMAGTYAAVIPQDGASVVSGMSFGQRSVASNTSQWLRQDRPQEFTAGVVNSSNSLAGGRGQFRHNVQVGSGSSVVSSVEQKSAGTQRDRPSALSSSTSVRGGDGQSVMSGGQGSTTGRQQRTAVSGKDGSIEEEEGANEPLPITKDEKAEILLNAFDNTRLPTHTPKEQATQEINVSLYQDDILDADEIAALPEDYVLDNSGIRYHPKEELVEEYIRIDQSLKRSEFEMFDGEYGGPCKSPFSRRQRMRTCMTILAAVALAVAGLFTSIRSLSPSPEQYASYANNENNVGRFLSPGRRFGGGGLVGGREQERREQLVYNQYYAPALEESAGYAPAVGRNAVNDGGYNGGRNSFSEGGTPGIASYQTAGGRKEDPFFGLGLPQFKPEYGIQQLPRLTSTPLTSYTPPANEDGISIMLEPEFNGAFIDVSVLPYRPSFEMPVVLDVPLSGGLAARQIFGNCLKLVQCSERGADILAREHKDWKENEGGGDGGSVGGRRRLGSMRLMALVPKGGKDPQGHSGKESHDIDARRLVGGDTTQEQETVEESSSAPFDPPLKMEVVYTSTYVNVDCSTPNGIDRGIAKELVTSDMADVIHSPNLHDVARLFAPPVKAYGRGIVMLRHPIERAVAKYDWLRTIDDDVKKMSLEEFARSDRLEDNILIRSMSSRANENNVLGRRELAVAKEILKRKFVVGLFDRMEESIGRFEIFFGWNIGEDGQNCQHSEVDLTMSRDYNKNVFLPPYNTAAYESLLEKSRLDMALYEYARFLYDYQGHVLFGINLESVE